MAVIATTLYYQDVGKIWQRVLTLWVSYLQTATKINWIRSLDVSTGYRAVVITVTQGANTLIDTMVDMGLPSSLKYPTDYLMSLPGWMTFPQALSPSFGAKVTASEFTATLAATREFIIEQFSTASLIASNTLNWTMNPVSAQAYIHYTIWQENARAGTDWMTLVTATTTPASLFGAGINPLEAGRTPSVPVIGATGPSEEQWAALVAALNDIALRDVDYTANNGSAIFSLRGRVNNE